MKKETLYIYLRVSTEKQEKEGYSLEAQEKTGIQKAKQLNMDYKIFNEESESSKYETIENRPILQKLISLIESGIAKNIFATEIDRLSRNDTVSAMIKLIFKNNGITLYTINGKYDLNNYDDEFMYNVLSSIAKRENLQRVRRSKAGRLEAARKGKYSGGILPFGYTKDKDNNLIVDEKEKKIYLKMVKYSLNGMGAKSIAKKLNEQNIPTKGSKTYNTKNGITLKNKYTGKITFKDKKLLTWRQGTITGILKNTLYKGEKKYLNEIIKVPACIDETTWQKIQDNFKKNKTYAGRNNKKNFYLLKGLLVCNRCGKTIIGLINKKKKMNVYYCLSKQSEITKFCGMKSINITELNNLIWDKLLYVLSNSSIVKKVLKKKFANTKENIIDINKEIKLLNNRLKEKEEEKTQLIRLITKKMITDKDFNKHLIEIEDSKQEIIRLIKQNEDKILLSQKEETTNMWIIKVSENMKRLYYLKDENKKQEIIRSFIQKITIDFLEDIKQHVIEIELKYPLFTDNKIQHNFLLDGTDLTKEPEPDEITLKEKYEIEDEDEENNKDNTGSGFNKVKEKALNKLKKETSSKINYDSAVSAALVYGLINRELFLTGKTASAPFEKPNGLHKANPCPSSTV
jgi:DNA invertase Pin-like site-specific DNA recombinase